jgi:hypothetical protein
VRNLVAAVVLSSLAAAWLGGGMAPRASGAVGGLSTEFIGEIKWVELSTGEDDHTHTLDPDGIMQMLMYKQ